MLVGDLHIDNRKSSIKNSESFDEVFRLFNLIVDTVVSERPDMVCFVGDIFDSPDYISTNVLSIAAMLFNDLSEMTKVVILAGNHDVVDDGIRPIDLTEGKEGKIRSSLVYHFGLNEEIFVVDTPSVTKFDDDKIRLTMIPYNYDIVKSIDSVSSQFKNDGYTNIMIGHFETKDLNYVRLVKDTNIVERLPSASELFNKYKQKLVILGHIHDKSIIEENENELYYIGSSRNINYNNKEEDSWIHILDLQSLDLKCIKNQNTAIYKVFRSSDDIEKYIETCSDEKLSKTKIKFIYTDPSDTIKYNQLKKKLRKLEFEKNIFNSKELDQDETRAQLEEIRAENILDKNNLFKFIIEFKSVSEDESEEYLNFINSFTSNEEIEEED